MTMRKLCALVALLQFVAFSAEAKVAIVVVRAREQTVANAGYLSQQTDYQQWADWPTAEVVGFLSRYGRKIGTDYDIYRHEEVASTRCGASGGTSCVKDGVIQGQTYSAVIWVGVNSNLLAQNPVANCWPCSLTLAAKMPSVPQLFINNGEKENMFALATSCSLLYQAANDPESQGPGFGSAVCIIPGQTMKFHRSWAIGQMVPIANPDGGWRTVVGTLQGAGHYDRDSTENVSFTMDSYGITANAHFDTANAFNYLVGERLNQHVAGSARNIVVNWATSAQTRMNGSTTITNDVGVNQNGDPFFIYCALAHLDSITGHALLGDNDPEPVRFAIQVEGLAARAAGTTDGGFPPDDTTAVYAGLDSLNDLDVPLAVGVNLDSAGTYQRDINVAKGIRRAKFSPWIRTGIDTTVLTAANGRSHPFHVVDPWGRYRNRAFVTPFSQAQADTSIRNLAQWARWRVDSIVGQGRFDGMLMAPDDDWSPKNVTNLSGDKDSLLYALALAGYRGISFNHEADTLNTTGIANPVGLSGPPEFRRIIYGDKSPFGIVAYTRMGNVGSAQAWQQRGTAESNFFYNIRKMWMSAYSGRWRFPDKEFFTRNGRFQDYTTPELTLPYGSNLRGVGPGYPLGLVSPNAAHEVPINILRLSTAGLGSGTLDAGGPDRPSWYAAKTLVNQTRVLNWLAGRNIAIIVYPGDLQPTDLR